MDDQGRKRKHGTGRNDPVDRIDGKNVRHWLALRFDTVPGSRPSSACRSNQYEASLARRAGAIGRLNEQGKEHEKQ
jgi:hypothetical protein